MQWIWLLVCVGSIWVQSSLLSAYMLMGGVAASRLGLWMFDLSVIQQMQVKKKRNKITEKRKYPFVKQYYVLHILFSYKQIL